MKPYLYRIAQVFLEEYKDDIHKLTFVFPNRRTGLFFQKYLSEITSKAIFSPDCITVNQCFEMLSDVRVADRLGQLFLLYDIYVKYASNPESFDEFVFWGEMILSDFNEVDKNLVDARQLFTNVNDLKNIDGVFDTLSEEQKKIIHQFWGKIIKGDDDKSYKLSFVDSWSKLLPMYNDFREQLLAEKQAYEGMMLRRVTERLSNEAEIEEISGKQFVFVGFNALNQCEKKLFTYFKKYNDADFYWNYESPLVCNELNSASMFVKENQTLFPSKFEIPLCDSTNDKGDDLQQRIKLVGIPSDVGQTAYVSKILHDLLPDESDLTQTAIVLPNENLLLPLLPALPQEIDTVNITMGYPLATTPMFGFMEHVFNLHKKVRPRGDETMFYHKDVLSLLRHQYVSFNASDNAVDDACSDVVSQLEQEIVTKNMIYVSQDVLCKNDLLRAIFSTYTTFAESLNYIYNILNLLRDKFKEDSASGNARRALDKEYIQQYYVTVNRIRDIALQRKHVSMSPETFYKLLRELTQGISIPFVGEPLNGLQIMGTLETRCLDFKNLIILSMNDGVFPKNQPTKSFIPYNLRRVFGLATYEQQDAIFAYNFYRLIHQAEHIHFLYDTRTDGGKTGEVSRFIHQLQYQFKQGIEPQLLAYNFKSNTQETKIQVEKGERVMGLLARFSAQDETKKKFSPSSLNNYLDCSLRFYLGHVEGLREQNDVEETIESSMFGTIFHNVMENIYKPFLGRTLEKNDIQEIKSDKDKIFQRIVLAYNQKHLKQQNQDKLIAPLGNDKLIVDVIQKYILRTLEKDKEIAPFKYVASEQKLSSYFPIGNNVLVNLKGDADRVDEVSGKCRILDYKTGKAKMVFGDLKQAFDKNMNDRPKFVLQTFFYAMLYADQNKDVNSANVEPGVIAIRNLFKNDYTTKLARKEGRNKPEMVENFAEYEAEFKEGLAGLLSEIMNPEIPFVQCDDVKRCEYCSFRKICNR